MAHPVLNDGTQHYLCPLFWQHGEPEETLRDYIGRMQDSGIDAFIAEARPHPEYLEEGWWRDMAILLDEARHRSMKVWIFDDGGYPSGNADGRIRREHPECLKTYWREYHIDATGPLYGSSFLVGDFPEEGEQLYRVLAAQRVGCGDALRPDTLQDLTSRVSGGRLYWDLPGGEWRLYVLVLSRHGLEEHTSGHVNPIDRQAVRQYIDLVHEAHYARFAADFGQTIAGFFTDEPRFGNIGGYDCCLGRPGMPLPYSPELEERLNAAWGGDFALCLPSLWYEAGNLSADARYTYMDEVSRLFASCFTGQLGDWCRSHGVKLIGHVVEENGAHCRLGFGAGHFFRAMQGLDAAGIDVVCNLYPEQTGGSYATLFNTYQCDFNHWGLAKLASSAAHLDPKKEGVALCEAFGAYGWAEGLKLMKWITDSLAVRGINRLVPHAFDPAPFPDWDCPPHFYAHGHNPQWRAFSVWAGYCTLSRRLDYILLH